MTKQEILDWVEESKWVDGDLQHDGYGNAWKTEIFEHDGKLFSVDFCNGSPCHKGRNINNYDPVEVRRVVKMVEKVTYEPVK